MRLVVSRTRRSRPAFLVVALLGPALWSTPLTAQVAVSEWLVLGPMPAPAASVEGDAALEAQQRECVDTLTHHLTRFEAH